MFLIAKSLELTINFLNSSITRTEKDTAIIISQSLLDSTLVDSNPPISIPIIGMLTLANCTKKSNSPKDAKKAITLICDAIKERKKIGVFGDYDVDGACSVALFKIAAASFISSIKVL